MKNLTITSESELQELLRMNSAYANGKNVRVSHLYATAAQSRFAFENIFGIYLTRPMAAWMAVWIAITDREKLRKRHLRYHAPRGTDAIGSIAIGGSGFDDAKMCFRSEAFLYLFERTSLPSNRKDLSKRGEEGLMEDLFSRGYAWKAIERRGCTRRAFLPPEQEPPSLLELDEWQAVAVGVPTLVPNTEVLLTGALLDALTQRVTFEENIPGRDYLSRR